MAMTTPPGEQPDPLVRLVWRVLLVLAIALVAIVILYVVVYGVAIHHHSMPTNPRAASSLISRAVTGSALRR